MFAISQAEPANSCRRSAVSSIPYANTLAIQQMLAVVCPYQSIPNEVFLALIFILFLSEFLFNNRTPHHSRINHQGTFPSYGILPGLQLVIQER